MPLALPTPGRVPQYAPLPSRRIPALATVLVLLIVAGVGLFLLRPRVLGRAHSPAPKRLAVLPFENQGDPGDAYFADGITDELRGKLTAIPGLEVVASQSSNDYRGTTKPLPQIARDLGVSYLLVGKIRWQKGTAGSSRVQVSPELVRIAPGTAPTTRWQQPFDASLTDVFQVQADIAAKVAGTLDVLLGDSTRRELIAAPTASLAAYDEFLKGEAASQSMKADQAGLRRAIGFYQRAVGLDSAFGGAWSQLSRARTSLYSNGVPDTTLARQARLAAERAQQLKPDDPLVYLALGDFYSSVNPVDNERAGAEYERGLRLAPDHVDLLSAAAISEALVGRWSGVAQRLQRALQLDPRSLSAARRLATAYIFLRQYAAADSAVDRANNIAPTNLQMALLKVMVTLQRGDLAGARAVVRAASGRSTRPRCSRFSPCIRTSTGSSTRNSSGRFWGCRRVRSTTTAAAGESCGPSSMPSTRRSAAHRRLRRLSAKGLRRAAPGRTRGRAAPRLPRGSPLPTWDTRPTPSVKGSEV